MALVAIGPDRASASDRPQLEPTHIVRVPDGPRGFALQVPFRFTVPGEGLPAQSVERIEARLTLRTGTGGPRTFAVRTTKFTVTRRGNNRRVFSIAHMDLPATAERPVKRAFSRNRSVRVKTIATVASDVTGDGAADSSSRLSAVMKTGEAISPLEARRIAAVPKAGGLGFTDPCDVYYGGPATCHDVQGRVFIANHFLESNTQQIYCPSGWSPINRLPLLFGGDPAYSVVTESEHSTSGSGFLLGGVGANVTITDWNISGHPIIYEPVLACCLPDDPNNAEACNGYAPERYLKSRVNGKHEGA